VTRPRLAGLAITSWTLAACAALPSTAGAEEAARPGAPGVVSRDGFELHYRIVGTRGPFLVVLAGGPGLDVDYMESVTSSGLCEDHRCVMLDQRGTGRSVLPRVDETTINWDAYLGDLEALRTGLGAEQLTLLGHSWGMTYALAYAGAHPGRVRGVVVLGTAPITAAFMQVFDDNRASRLHPSERSALAFWSDAERSRQDPDRATWEYLRAITPTDFWDRDKGLAHAMRWRLEWCHGRVGEVSAKTIWEGLDLRPRLDAVTAPVLLVHGHQDVAGEANTLEAKVHLRRGRVVFVQRSGHYPWLDQPEGTWRDVRAFLGGLPD
jgi:proline iminopeptidase